MLRGNTDTISGVADTIALQSQSLASNPRILPFPTIRQRRNTYKNTNIQRLPNPICWYPLAQRRLDAPYIPGTSSTQIIDVTAQAWSMVWIADQKYALDSVVGCVREFRESGDCCGGAL